MSDTAASPEQAIAQVAEAVKKKSFLMDANGDMSSKRLWGSIAMAMGVLIKTLVSAIVLTSLIPVTEVAVRAPIALGAADGLLMAGAAILGITVAESFAKKV